MQGCDVACARMFVCMLFESFKPSKPEVNLKPDHMDTSPITILKQNLQIVKPFIIHNAYTINMY